MIMIPSNDMIFWMKNPDDDMYRKLTYEIEPAIWIGLERILREDGFREELMVNLKEKLGQ